VGIAGTAAAAFGEPLVGAAEGGLDQNPVTFASPPGRRRPLDDADNLVPGDERPGTGIGGEDIRDRVALHEREVGPADAGQGGADQDPSGTWRNRGTNVANLDRKRGALGRTTTPSTPPATGPGVHEGRIDD
jgi:hypothetical protein